MNIYLFELLKAKRRKRECESNPALRQQVEMEAQQRLEAQRDYLFEEMKAIPFRHEKQSWLDDHCRSPRNVSSIAGARFLVGAAAAVARDDGAGRARSIILRERNTDTFLLFAKANNIALAS